MIGRRIRRTVAVTALAVAATGCSILGRGPGDDALERGDAAFRAGDYAAAARAWESYLAAGPRSEEDQVVWLRLAVIYLFLGTPETDPVRGDATLERMIETHPSGRLREVAETILALRDRIEAERRETDSARGDRRALEARIEELERRLEALKSIDLEDRPRRPPPD